MDENDHMGLLTGLKVLEIGEHISAPYAAANFVRLGAEVVKIETARGDVSRGYGPYPNARRDKEPVSYTHLTLPPIYSV